MNPLKRRSKSFPRDSANLQEEMSPVPMELGETPPRTNESVPVMDTLQEDESKHAQNVTPKVRKVRGAKRTHKKSNEKLLRRYKLGIIYCIAMVLTLCVSWRLLSVVERCGQGPVEFDFGHLEVELEEKTFGQNRSISYFIDNLKTFMKDDSASVMVTWFLGGQGVGKTLTADIVGHAVQSGNVIKYFIPVDFPTRYSTKDIFNMINSRLDPCQLSLIIFDDMQYLTTDSKKQLLNFFTLFQHGDFHKKMVFVLVSQEGSGRIRSIVSDDPEEDPSVISTVLVEENEIPSLTFFRSLTEYLVVVPFYPLRTKDAEKCVSRDGQIKVDYLETGMFLESGCKGILSKLKT